MLCVPQVKKKNIVAYYEALWQRCGVVGGVVAFAGLCCSQGVLVQVESIQFQVMRFALRTGDYSKRVIFYWIVTS